MTVKDLVLFYINKKEHYDISDSFVKCNNGKYQQSKTNGYMVRAKEMGVTIDYTQAEPNQKWHLLKSYCARTDDDFEINNATFKCPELILWIAEAAGIDKKVIIEAKKNARIIIDEGVDGRARNVAGKCIIDTIGWNAFEEKIMGK